MTMFRIAYKTSGHSLGHYAGETPDEAIAAMARDSSYGNFVASCLGQDVEVAKRELTVELINKPVAAGYVCYEQDNRNIQGKGDTVEAARAQANEEVRCSCAVLFRFDEAKQKTTFAEVTAALEVLPATAALIEEAFTIWGGRWQIVDGVACTYAETYGAEHPDDAAVRKEMSKAFDIDAEIEAVRGEYYA